jgi:hypothetical protein
MHHSAHFFYCFFYFRYLLLSSCFVIYVFPFHLFYCRLQQIFLLDTFSHLNLPCIYLFSIFYLCSVLSEYFCNYFHLFLLFSVLLNISLFPFFLFPFLYTYLSIISYSFFNFSIFTKLFNFFTSILFCFALDGNEYFYLMISLFKYIYTYR